MFTDDDDEAGAALRALADEPTPARTTRLDDVIRQGRRQVRRQRASALIGVVVVVAGIGAGLSRLSGRESGPMPIADQPSVSNTAPAPTTVTTSPQPDTPTSVSTTVSPPLPTPLFPPTAVTGALKDWRSPAACDGRETDTPLRPSTPLLPQGKVELLLVESLNAIARTKGVIVRSAWGEATAPFNPNGRLQVEFPAGPGGTVYISHYRVAGNPKQAADSDLDPSTCPRTKRGTTATGAVVQLSPKSGERTVNAHQVVRVYLPNGLAFQLMAASWGSSEPRTPDSMPDLGRLPLTDDQLVALAVAAAALGS